MAEQETSTQSTNTATQKSPIALYIGAAIIVAIGLGIWGLSMYGEDLFPAMGDGTEESTSREYPDVVARVNGEEISGTEFAEGVEEFRQTAAQQGIDPNDAEALAQIEEQVLTGLMNRTIVVQNATQAGITVSTEDVDARIAEIETQMGGAEALQAQMTNLGVTEAELRSDIEQDILVNTYLQANIADVDTSVTDEEVSEFYAEVAAQQEEGTVPPIEEVTEQIRQQLVAQKENTAIQAFIRDLQTSANIEVLI